MRVRVRRRGGIAGNVTVAAELDTASLPPAQSAPLEAALDRLPWGGPAPAAPHPDAFSYELSLLDDPGRGVALLGEGGLDEELAPLLDRIAEVGVVEEPRRPGGAT